MENDELVLPGDLFVTVVLQVPFPLLFCEPPLRCAESAQWCDSGHCYTLLTTAVPECFSECPLASTLLMWNVEMKWFSLLLSTSVRPISL